MSVEIRLPSPLLTPKDMATVEPTPVNYESECVSAVSFLVMPVDRAWHRVLTDRGDKDDGIIYARDMCRGEANKQPQERRQNHHHHKEPGDNQQDIAIIVMCHLAVSGPFREGCGSRRRHVYV
jgi:hypothetical protein